MKEKKILAFERPALLKEWDYEKNSLICSPDEIVVGSHKKVWWKCSKCNYSWVSPVNKRAVFNHRCPACANQVLFVGMNDLKTKHPELANEWDKSNDCKPNEIIYTSSSKRNWKCRKCGYKWIATVRNRSMGSGCPACVNQVVWKGHNDLKTVFPLIAAEWDYDANTTGPDEVAFGSAKKAWWKCSRCNHKWRAVIVSRTANGNGCPRCGSRYQTSLQEQTVLFYVSKYFKDSISRYTEIFDNKMELDIYFPSIMTGIEYDGKKWHGSSKSQLLDKEKYKICRDKNIKLIRIREDFNCKEEIADVIIKCDYKRDKYTALSEAVNELLQLLSIKENINVAEDINIIREKYYGYLGENSLEVKFPRIASEWDYNKNGNITPKMVFSKSGDPYWWECGKCGYQWKAKVSERTRGRGCPVCANKTVWVGHNDLQTLYPKLSEKWNYEKNTILPSEIVPGSYKKVWWKCPDCNYGEWYSSPKDMISKNIKCPCCTGRVLIKGKNDLQTLFPDVAKEWDFEKNNDKPTDITTRGKTSYNWICSDCGYKWKASLQSRTRKNQSCGCPQCGKRKAATARSIPVRCIETKTEYSSIVEAAIKTGVNKNSISKCCKDKTKSKQGLHWEYVNKK